MDYSDPQGQTLSIPSLVAFAVVSFLAIRWFFFSTSNASSSSTSAAATGSTSRQQQRALRRHNFSANHVDQVTSMFPQLNRRDVEWDLVQNGGSVQATTERVLTVGRLSAAPPNFTPIYGVAPSQNTSTTMQQQQQQQQGNKSSFPDLITRYNLSSRVEERDAAEDDSASQGRKDKGGWSSSKTERQALLKKRRDDMILEARRKLEDRERKGKGPA